MNFTKEERDLIRSMVDDRWRECDKARMDTRPGSREERIWLEAQQALEVIQGKLAADSVTGRI